eukprot:2973414-Pleurochrysis_carterae.AAC.1
MNETTGKWHTASSCAKTHETWREIVSSIASYDANNTASFIFRTSARITCGDFARAAYGLPQITWDQYLSALRQNPHA